MGFFIVWGKMMVDIETIGWTKDNKFFEVNVNMLTGMIFSDDVRSLAGLFCYKYSGDLSGCQFTTKFALVYQLSVFVHSVVFDADASVDDDFIEISFDEYKKLK